MAPSCCRSARVIFARCSTRSTRVFCSDAAPAGMAAPKIIAIRGAAIASAIRFLICFLRSDPWPSKRRPSRPPSEWGLPRDSDQRKAGTLLPHHGFGRRRGIGDRMSQTRTRIARPRRQPPLPAPTRVESRAMSADGRHAAQLVADRQDDGRDHISLMTRFRRHAIYWAPPAGSAFARFGASWLGWDAETGRAVSTPCQHAAAPPLVAEPRRYGFHATLKPPLRLAEGMAEGALESAVAKIASSIAPFQMPALRIARMGSRVALV